MAAGKRRIDQLLVERGLAESRQKAQALLIAGQVLVNGQKIEKPGRTVAEDADIRILRESPFVSRAGAKLQAALTHFHIEAAGKICADLGASTGGFTDCLLQNGALAVHAYDVGVSQLAWKLRRDPRVIVHEHCNVRYLTAQGLPEEISLVAIDLSFISLTRILGPVGKALREHAASRAAQGSGSAVDLVALVKPQFEVGRGEVGKGGLVRDEEKRLQALSGIEAHAAAEGYGVVGSIPSPVLGAKGNQEFLLYLVLSPGL